MNRAPSYNAKARGSGASGSRKKGKPKRKSTAGVVIPTLDMPDTNTDILASKTKEERDRDRKERMIAEVRLLNG
jgi:ATP-dependent RNA helicase DHX37/DHR1